MNVDEKLLLNSILKGGKDAYIDACQHVTSESFESAVTQIVFSSFETIFEANRNYNLANVLSICSNTGLSSGDIDKIKSIFEDDTVDSDVSLFAQKIKKRNLINESINLHDKCIDDLGKLSGSEEITDIFSISESSIFDLVNKYANEKNNGVQIVGDKSLAMLKDWEENPVTNVGLPTPWPRFNESIGGGMRTGVTLVGARSGVGKSIIGIITSIHVAQLDIPVLYLDTEMEMKDVVPRILANMAEVDIKDIETGVFAQDSFNKEAVYGSQKKLANIPLYYKTVAGENFESIMSTIRRWVYSEVGIQENGKSNDCLIVYDYFKLMDSSDMGDMQETQALGFQISKLTDFCKRYDLPCLSFVQLNRDGISKEDSGVIAQSDRLLWLTNSFSIFKVKGTEEMDLEKYKFGNRKIKTIKSRYGGEHYGGQHISMNMKPEKSILLEMPNEPPK